MALDRGRGARFLTGGEDVLPARWRLAVFVLGAAPVAGIYLVTQSEGLQVLVAFAVIFGLVPLLTRRYGRRDDYRAAIEDANPPLRVFLMSLLLVAPWGAVCWFSVPAGLGPWTWLWLVMWPWAEAFRFWAERAGRRNGTDSWKRTRPLRDSALAAVATVPVIFVLSVTDDLAIQDAALTSVACGVIVFAVSGGLVALDRRATRGHP